ncbi:MAG: tyrosine-type recombinase/integrase [Acidiferrobacterales bacterium]
MFETLFKYPAVVSRHRNAPLAEERERYLAHRAKDGTSLGTLRRFARELLVVVREMDLRPTTISVEAIESAAEHWASHQKGRGRADQLRWSRSLFVQVAQAWLRFLGRLEEPEVNVVCYAALINDFTRFLHAERGLSAKTIRNYAWYVDKFLAWLDASACGLATTSVLDVDAFITQHHSWSRVTLACCAKSLRSFFRYAARRGWCAGDIAAAIESPRIFKQEALPTGPDWPSVRELIVHTDSGCPRDVRDRAILLLFSTYGFRSSEVAQLKLDDVDWERERIRVHRCKRRHDQEYPLIHSIGAAIVRYLKEVRPRTNQREIFLTLRAPFRPLSTGTMYRVVSSRMTKLDIQSLRQGPHSLRHASAGHLVEEGFSLKEIGDHLGHRSSFSTRTYAKVDLPGLQEVASFDLGDLS